MKEVGSPFIPLSATNTVQVFSSEAEQILVLRTQILYNLKESPFKKKNTKLITGS